MKRTFSLTEKTFLSAARMLYWLALLAVDVYAAGFLVYFVLRWASGDEMWVVAFVGIFLHWLLLPVFAALIVALPSRSRLRIGALAFLSVLYLHLFGGLFVPGPTQAAPPGSTELTFITFNVANDNADPEHLAALIREENADVVALVELGDWIAADTLAYLGSDYPYHVVIPAGVPGKAIISRYPIVDHEIFFMHTNRPNIQARIRVGDELITVFVVHPPSPNLRDGWQFFELDPRNQPEITMLLERASAQTPTVLLGDFNLTDQNDTYDLIREAGFIDSFREVGQGLGLTYGWRRRTAGLVRIDYVWVSPHFQPLESYVGPRFWSDHRPVISRVALRP